MLEQLQDVIEYINEKMLDPVPQYILKKEVLHSSSYESENNKRKESKWYKQLASEQWENGSWGRFHTQDTKSNIKQKFNTTENALRRARELSLDKNNEMIYRAIQLMERYLQGQEEWLDTNEHSYGFEVAFRTLIAANLSLFDPKHTLVQARKEICAENFEKAFKNGKLNEDIWEKENKVRNEILLNPFTVYIIWLMQNNDFLDEANERNFLEYIWNRKDGIYYCTYSPSSEIEYLESKGFLTWLNGLENLSDFSLFPEFMNRATTSHLLNEIHRLMYNDVLLPNTSPIYGHYSESWSKREFRKNDLILRILRVLMKC